MKKIIFVCIANYCRSPVAEKIMSHLAEDLKFDSCGLHPYPSGEMDSRSEQYLTNNQIKNITHFPKKITTSLLEEAELIIPMDVIVLNSLLKNYKKYSSKIKVFNFYA